MRRILLIAAILAAYAFGSQVFAQGTAKNAEKKTTTSYPLTDKQKGDYTRLETAEKDGQDALQRAIVSALEIPVSPTTSVQFHAQIREIQLKLGSLAAQKSAWLAQARLEANCKDCVIEGDRLTKPK
jgi:hypothetical protein